MRRTCKRSRVFTLAPAVKTANIQSIIGLSRLSHRQASGVQICASGLAAMICTPSSLAFHRACASIDMASVRLSTVPCVFFVCSLSRFFAPSLTLLALLVAQVASLVSRPSHHCQTSINQSTHPPSLPPPTCQPAPSLPPPPGSHIFCCNAPLHPRPCSP